MRNSNKINLKAFNHKRDLIKKNEKLQMGIKELSAQPPLYDFVKCKVDNNELFEMFLGGNDDGVALRFYWNDSYEEYSLSLWTKISKFLEKKDFILDIGAHTGAYALASMSVSQANVAAFEPYALNFARLKMNAKANGYRANNLFMVAVSDANGSVPFTINTDPTYLTTGGKVGKSEKGFSYVVPSVALDDFISDELKASVKLIKIDTEGHEARCLKGAERLIEVSKPIIFFESIDAESGKEVEAFFSRHNYLIYEIDDINHTLKLVDGVSPRLDQKGRPIMSLLNRLAVHSEKKSILLEI